MIIKTDQELKETRNLIAMDAYAEELKDNGLFEEEAKVRALTTQRWKEAYESWLETKKWLDEAEKNDPL